VRPATPGRRPKLGRRAPIHSRRSSGPCRTLERQGQTRYDPPEAVEVRGTYQLTTQDKQACFERVEATGLSDDLPSPPLPDGCWN